MSAYRRFLLSLDIAFQNIRKIFFGAKVRYPEDDADFTEKVAAKRIVGILSLGARYVGATNDTRQL